MGGTPTELTDEQVARLETYEDLLRTHAIPFGFVAASDAGNLRERHLNDSLRGAALVRATDRVGIDLGSGAGLPGIVIAIACPTLEVTLAESRRAKAAFLELVVETLGLPNVSVHAGRVEDLRASADLCFARAFRSAPKSWKQAERFLSSTGRLVYWAGTSFELRDAPDGVRCEAFPSVALARSGPLVMMCRQ
ncbi:MAG: 16S rRNA (guanine(527)-N(7))-methyltransferase RsmG [Actinomycetota bacterium]|nr:16S rRNA (guanine(527)-N(7))-methyltransferase RsmG [Actinomycetota bacterium]